MDARTPTPRKPRIERFFVAVLAVVVALGLWQGYGYWLLGRVHAG